jgi:predicted RNA-binding protein with PIN domain
MAADKVDQARALLHQLLVRYASDKQQEVLVVYDATTVSATGEDRISRVSDRVQILFRAGFEADYVIISAVADLHKQHAAAAAAGLPSQAAAARRVVVVTNDRRIQAACSEPDLFGGSGGSVFCQGNFMLSKDLQEVQKDLARFNNGENIDNPAAAAAAVAAAAAAGRNRPAGPSINQNSYAWAKRVLLGADTAAACRSSSGSSRKQSRHRKQQQQQAQEAPSSEQLLSDEELLQKAKAAAAAVDTARTSSSVAASSTSQVLDELLLLDDLDDLLA